MGQTTVGAFTCVGGRALFKKVATRTDGANLLRIAHKGSVTKLAALFALAGGRDKGADVVNSSPKLNVIGQGEMQTVTQMTLFKYAHCFRMRTVLACALFLNAHYFRMRTIQAG